MSSSSSNLSEWDALQSFHQLWLWDERSLPAHSKLSMSVLAPGEELTSFTHRTKENSSASLLPLSLFGSGSKNQCCFQRSSSKVRPSFGAKSPCLLLIPSGQPHAACVTQDSKNKGRVLQPIKPYLQEVPNQRGGST